MTAASSLMLSETVYVIERDVLSRDYYAVAQDIETTPEIEAAIMALANAFDAGECQAENCHKRQAVPPLNSTRFEPRGAVVGWYLAEGDEGGTSEGFAYTALVVPAEGKPFFICEDCHAALLPVREKTEYQQRAIEGLSLLEAKGMSALTITPGDLDG